MLFRETNKKNKADSQRLISHLSVASLRLRLSVLSFDLISLCSNVSRLSGRCPGFGGQSICAQQTSF